MKLFFIFFLFLSLPNLKSEDLQQIEEIFLNFIYEKYNSVFASHMQWLLSQDYKNYALMELNTRIVNINKQGYDSLASFSQSTLEEIIQAMKLLPWITNTDVRKPDPKIFKTEKDVFILPKYHKTNLFPHDPWQIFPKPRRGNLNCMGTVCYVLRLLEQPNYLDPQVFAGKLDADFREIPMKESQTGDCIVYFENKAPVHAAIIITNQALLEKANTCISSGIILIHREVTRFLGNQFSEKFYRLKNK